MEGVIDPIIRELFSLIGGYDQMVTEFIRVTHQLLPEKVFIKYSPELNNKGCTKHGTPVFIQLLGGQAQPLAENAALAAQLGAPGIDLNFGCPAKRVNHHDGGAVLLKQPHRLYDIIHATRKAVARNIPVTAKVRLGYEDKSLCQEIAMAVNEAGANAITIHARTKLEGYKPPAHWEYIYEMKSLIKNMLVIANGDIWNLEDFYKCREITGCDSFALGRPAFAHPFLAQMIKNSLSGAPVNKVPWPHFKKNYLFNFYEECFSLKGEHFAASRLKQWSKFLGRQHPEAALFFEEIKRLEKHREILSTFNITTQ